MRENPAGVASGLPLVWTKAPRRLSRLFSHLNIPYKSPMTKPPKSPKLEHSELSGEFTEDDITVLVDIFRKAGSQEDWTMEVVTQNEDLIRWDEPFATDREAFDEFLATIARDGIASFVEDDDVSVH
jgi:hypothetical protein